ncbi:MAG: T9SS type A sorting domain-containing protein [Candidatus Aegiribacteria sp.]|nr:T9SS type A sorting domain-containing protein [Candidatus Aegiribacteria sp.]
MRKPDSWMLVLAICLLLLPFQVLAQITFECWYGGGRREEGQSVTQTSDDGYAMCGYTKSFGDPDGDVYLVRTDEYGDTLWTRTFGGSSLEQSFRVEQTNDDGFIIAGLTHSFGSLSQMYLVKTDSFGNLDWQGTYGGGYVEYGYSAQQTSDNGYIICGSSNTFGAGSYDMYLVKTDSLGVMDWQKTFGGTGNDRGHTVEQTDEGGYILAGYTNSFGAGGADVYLVRTDGNGDTLWTGTYGGSDDDLPHYGRCVRQTYDGGFVVAGYTKSFGAGSYDIYLLKTDFLGNMEWEKTYGGSDLDLGRSVEQLPDGGFIIAGSTKNFGAVLYDVYLVRTDADGGVIWTETFGGSDYDYAESVQRTSDGGFIIGGYTKSYGSGEFDFYLIKTEPDMTGIEETGSQEIITFFGNEPNPFENFTTVEYNLAQSCIVDVSVYDVNGRLIKELETQNREAGVHSVIWDGMDNSGMEVTSGIYFCLFRTSGVFTARKMCLIR